VGLEVGARVEVTMVVGSLLVASVPEGPGVLEESVVPLGSSVGCSVGLGSEVDDAGGSVCCSVGSGSEVDDAGGSVGSAVGSTVGSVVVVPPAF